MEAADAVTRRVMSPVRDARHYAHTHLAEKVIGAVTRLDPAAIDVDVPSRFSVPPLFCNTYNST
jgi:hypothetical protein